MKTTTKVLLIVTTFLFGLTSFSFASVQEPQKRKGHILFKMRDGTTQIKKDRAKKILQGHRSWTKKRLNRNDVSLEFLDDQKGLTEEDICKALVASGGVEFAEPDYLVPPEAIPNDPKYSSEWHHTKINSPAAWDYATGDPRIIVAVCDTGVQSTHPDLAANLILPGFNTVDGSTNTEPVMGHGTSTTGSLAAIGNNGAGVAGMAWGVKVLPIRVSNTSDGCAYYSDLSEAITYAADHDAKVISVSYGVGGSSTIDNAAKYARNKGALVFVAAGNSNALVTYSDYTSFILVGATDQNDAKASFSNYGKAIDLVAPGTSIYYTTTGSGYSSGSGTSFSTPIAAGLAALIFSVNPNLKPEEVETFIFSTCVDLGTPGRDDNFGRGRINAAAAVRAAKGYFGNLPPVALFEPSAYTGTTPLNDTFDASASYDNDGTIASYAWDFGDGTTGTGKVATHTFSVAGNYNIKLTVTDNMGETNANTKTITASAATLPPSEIIIDNSDTSRTNTVGTWTTSTIVAGYYGTSYQHHYAGTGANSFSWVPASPTSGTYEVFARWTAASNRATNAKYTITHQSGNTTVEVNQQLNNNAWVSLGKYSFVAGGSAQITLTDNANNYVIADAVKLVFVNNTISTATAPSEIIIDNSDTSRTNIIGTWTTSTIAAGYYGTSYQHHYAGTGANSFSWIPAIPTSGTYEVFARWTASSNRATNAKYTVSSTTVEVNQQLNNNTWVSLGKYSFTAGSTAQITLTDNANNYVIADAVKLVFVN